MRLLLEFVFNIPIAFNLLSLISNTYFHLPILSHLSITNVGTYCILFNLSIKFYNGFVRFTNTITVENIVAQNFPLRVATEQN